ncbi:hypothetical protein ANN_19174 [Periplaneta americana]|uniref:Endonuclease-reverse transcriptase n=1 Tax=Periplaneta americana TaxID=6978 RepID=A0ABQ8S954_PERAM|nr:hypothetical protein ANN_19174 [Periplaneta americana]
MKARTTRACWALSSDEIQRAMFSSQNRFASCINAQGHHFEDMILSKNLKVRIYKTLILPVVLYGCETWTLTLREEQRLRVFENKVFRTTFGAKRDEITGEWRKLHNAELHSLYSSPDIIRNIKSRRLRWAGLISNELKSYVPLLCSDYQLSFSNGSVQNETQIYQDIIQPQDLNHCQSYTKLW